MNNKQKILIIGGGGREHAIGWKMAQSPRCGALYFAPGNAGTAKLGTNIDIKATDIEGLIKFAKTGKIDPVRSKSPQGDSSTRSTRAASNGVDLTLAIPDDPLALGVVDAFQENGLRIFGPTKKASQLESSKAFAKNFMKRNNLPTAQFEVFTDFEKAETYLKNHSLPVVVKVSGLALGKGVSICETYEEAREALENILIKKSFRESGDEVVIEEFLTGPEISIHVFSDGKSFSMFPTSQDHKRVGENDEGPNTGGMGTVAPLPFIDALLLNNIKETIVEKTLNAMNEEGDPFIGVLYPGLMLTKDGPKILEYNARFGDPETETYMRLLETDLLDIVDACIDQKLSEIEIKWKKVSACTIVLASGGYPGIYEKGKVITGTEEAEKEKDIVIFHAGTTIKDGELVTNGGRVLGVSAIGHDLKEALERAYKAVSKISFPGMQYRRDIGAKALLIK